MSPLCESYVPAEALNHMEPFYPLHVWVCRECLLVQLDEYVTPEHIFTEYAYFSSFSTAWLKHAEDYTTMARQRLGLGPKSLVVELASNDGYLLQHYQHRNVPVLGIEPAANVATVARERGIPTVSEFFSESLAAQLIAQHRRADVIHANNVLAHVPDLPGFVRAIAALLKSDGIAVIEVPHAIEMIDRAAFDTIYHEHLCYFSVTALTRLFDACGLQLYGVEKLPVHGGSLRLFAGLPFVRSIDPSVRAILDEEARWGVRELKTYESFATRVAALGTQVRSTVTALKAQGHRIAGYGASAKGCVMMNYAGLDSTDLDFIVDASPHKQGRFVPGTGVPICAPSHLIEQMPAHTLLLVWNIAEEVFRQQAEYRRKGGSFIVPVPEARRTP